MENKNLTVDFEKTKLLPYVLAKRLFTSPVFAIIRICGTTISIFLVFLFLARLSNLLPSFEIKILNPVFLAAYLYLIFEAYLLFGLSAKIPGEKVATVSQNMADTISFAGLDTMLSSSDGKDNFYPERFISKIADHNLGKFVFLKANLDQKIILSTIPKETVYTFGQIIPYAFSCAKEEGKENIGVSDILYATFCLDKNLQKVLFEAEVELSDLLNIIFWYDATFLGEEKKLSNTLFVGAGIGEAWAYGYTLATDKYGSDITAKLAKQEIDPFVVGRDAEIEALEKVLSRSERANAILIGPAGVGKTSIIYGLAKKSSKGATLPILSYNRILYLDIGSLIAGAQDRGEIESRLKQVLNEAKSAGNVILYIDEIQNMAGAQVAERPVDLTGLMIETLRSSKIHIIAAATAGNYRRYIETRPAFRDMFEKMDIVELSKNDTIRALERISPLLEKRFRISITYKAITETVELSNNYLQGKVLPGKAIDLLEEASSNLGSKKILEKPDIEKLITQKTKIPVGRTKKDEGKILLNLEQVLHKRVIGQDEAVKAVSDALRRARVMVREKGKPIGNFLFLGPTGVGKTQTAKTLASSYFGSENSMIRLDMTEFSQSGSVELLVGSQNTPGQLTEAVKGKPYALILLDELEKAHKDVLNLFLQVFDDGRLVDSDGNVINFSQTIIIATSNAGSELIRQKIKSNEEISKIRGELLDYLQSEKIFTPEFLNRFDEIVVFKPLAEKDLQEVSKVLLSELSTRLRQKEINLEMTDRSLSLLSKLGYDPVYGARPLRRVIQDQLEAQIAKLILADSLKRGQTVVVDAEGANSFSFNVKIGKFG